MVIDNYKKVNAMDEQKNTVLDVKLKDDLKIHDEI